MYFVFYLLLPIMITYFSLKISTHSLLESGYCFVTILISALNGIYDAINRWDIGKKTVRNTKIGFICFANIVVFAYCTFMILEMVITENMNVRCDCILCVYSVTCSIAMWDLGKTLSKYMAIKQSV